MIKVVAGLNAESGYLKDINDYLNEKLEVFYKAGNTQPTSLASAAKSSRTFNKSRTKKLTEIYLSSSWPFLAMQVRKDSPQSSQKVRK